LREEDYRDSGTVRDDHPVRRSRGRSIAVRVIAYLAIAALLFLFGRILMANPSMRRAVLDFVTFGHPQWVDGAIRRLAQHGIGA